LTLSPARIAQAHLFQIELACLSRPVYIPGFFEEKVYFTTSHGLNILTLATSPQASRTRHGVPAKERRLQIPFQVSPAAFSTLLNARRALFDI
jgi:hypothetical protein